MFQSQKRLRIFFQKFGVSCFSRIRLATCSQVEGPIARGTQRFLRLSSRLSREWNFQSWKTLRKFFKSFLSSVLVVGPGGLHATWFSHKIRVCCAKRSFSILVSKGSSFLSLTTSDCSFFYLTFPLSTPPCSLTAFSTILSSLSQSSRKGLGFVSYSLSFSFTAYSFCIVCFYWYLYISWLYMGICFSGEIIVWFLVVIFGSTLSWVNIRSLITHTHTHTHCLI